MPEPRKGRIQLKHDVSSNWQMATNFIPRPGEFINYDDMLGHKIGDGVHNVNELNLEGVGKIQQTENLNTETNEYEVEYLGEIFNDYENNIATGKHSHASGSHTKATADNQFVTGQYNTENEDALFIVGNGDDTASSNAFEVLKDGSVVVQTQGTSNNAVLTKGTLDDIFLDVKKLPGVTYADNRYKIGAALNKLFWSEGSKGAQSKVIIPPDNYYLEEPVVVPIGCTIDLTNAKVRVANNQTYKSVPSAHLNASGKTDFCGFKLGRSSCIKGGSIQSNSTIKSTPIILMDAEGYYAANDTTILVNAQVLDSYIYNENKINGINIQINGGKRAATACIIKNTYLSGGNPSINIDKGDQPTTWWQYFCNGNTIDCRINQAPTMININGDGNLIEVEGQVYSFSDTTTIPIVEFESGQYYSAQDDSSVLTEKPIDWDSNYFNYYIKTQEDFFDDTLIKFITVEENIKQTYASDTSINTNTCFIINGVRNTIHSRVYDLGNVNTTTLNKTAGTMTCRFNGHNLIEEQSGHSNRLYNPFGTLERISKGGIDDIYLKQPYFGNNMFAYAYEQGLLLDATSEDLAFWKYEFGSTNGEPNKKTEAELIEAANGNKRGFLEYFKDLFAKPNYRIFMYPTNTEPSLSLILKLDVQIDMFGFSFFERKFTFKNYRLEVGDYENGEFKNSLLIKESPCQKDTKIYFDYPNDRRVFKALKITFYGREAQDTSDFIRMTSIYGTNEVSDNMLLQMSGGSVYGPMIFEPATLKIKDTVGNVKTIEEKLAEVSNSGGTTPSFDVSNFANALKEKVSGNPIELKDISPLSSSVTCKAIFNNKNKLPSDVKEFTNWQNVGTRAYAYSLDGLLEVGKTYCFSAEFENWTSGTPVGYLYIQEGTDSTFATKTNYQLFQNTTKKTPPTFEVKEGYFYRVYYYYDNGKDVFSSYKNFMIEEGTTATEYVEYVAFSGSITELPVNITDENGNTETKYPNEDGIIIYPHNAQSLTFTTSEGVVLECEYSKDINKVLGQIEDTLNSMMTILNTLMESASE